VEGITLFSVVDADFNAEISITVCDEHATVEDRAAGASADLGHADGSEGNGVIALEGHHSDECGLTALHGCEGKVVEADADVILAGGTLSASEARVTEKRARAVGSHGGGGREVEGGEDWQRRGR